MIENERSSWINYLCINSINIPNSPRHSISSSVHTFQPPEFNFSLYMLSFSKQLDLEKELAAIELALANTQPFQYQLRGQLRDEKDKLLEQLKGKKKVDEQPQQKTVSFHEPATVYRKLSRSS